MEENKSPSRPAGKVAGGAICDGPRLRGSRRKGPAQGVREIGAPGVETVGAVGFAIVDGVMERKKGVAEAADGFEL